MKRRLSIVKAALLYGALLLLLFPAVSCSNKSGGSSAVGAGNPDTTGGANASSITVLANPAAITPGGTSTITATVKDNSGNPVADGISVTFSLNTNAYGTLANSTVTTAGGVATTTFTASSVSGSVTITAASGENTTTLSLTVGTVSAGSIRFVSATPTVLGIKGSGQAETAVVTFQVSNVNGDPVEGATVNFVMTGPNGGEFIGDIDATPNLASAVTSSGNAAVILNSGKIAGPVTITASTIISSGTISTSATPISIGGGVPSATHFSLARTIVNLEGLNWDNLQSIVEAFLADRFGNYNVMDGTSVSFYTEAGAIDRQAITGTTPDTGDGSVADTLSNTGEANVIFRTQNPLPEDVPPTVAGELVSAGYFDGNNEPHRVSRGITYNPRDGWVSVLATTKGEEKFLDENLDGLFTRSYKEDKCPYSSGVICECDGGVTGGYAGFILQGEMCTDVGKPGGKRSEGFVDRPEDPFYDVNDDGVRDDGQTLGKPFELFIDENANGVFDGVNGKWDGPDCQTAGCNRDKTIWTDTRMVFSGEGRFYSKPDNNNCYRLITDVASTCTASASFDSGEFAVATTNIPKGGSGKFEVIVGDKNLNSLQEDTTITVTASTLASAPSSTGTASVITVTPSSYTFKDGLSRGPVPFGFTVNVPLDTTADMTTITVEVTTPNSSYTKKEIDVQLQ